MLPARSPRNLQRQFSVQPPSPPIPPPTTRLSCPSPSTSFYVRSPSPSISFSSPISHHYSQSQPLLLRAPPPSPNSLSVNRWPPRSISPSASTPSASPHPFATNTLSRCMSTDHKSIVSGSSGGRTPAYQNSPYQPHHPPLNRPLSTPQSAFRANHKDAVIVSHLPTHVDSNGRCKTYCRELIAFLFSHLGLCLLLIGYMLMGAAIFQELESDPTAHLQVPQRAVELQNETLTRLFAKVRHLSVFADQQITETQLAGELNAVLADYTRRMVEYIGDGYDPNAALGESSSLPLLL
jgi:hypothetical protein